MQDTALSNPVKCNVFRKLYVKKANKSFESKIILWIIYPVPTISCTLDPAIWKHFGIPRVLDLLWVYSQSRIWIVTGVFSFLSPYCIILRCNNHWYERDLNNGVISFFNQEEIMEREREESNEGRICSPLATCHFSIVSECVAKGYNSGESWGHSYQRPVGTATLWLSSSSIPAPFLLATDLLGFAKGLTAYGSFVISYYAIILSYYS